MKKKSNRKLTSYFKRIKKMILDKKRNMIKGEYEDFTLKLLRYIKG